MGICSGNTAGGNGFKKTWNKKPVLILGHSFEEEFERIVEDDLEPAIFTYESAKVLSETAKRFKKTAKIHIKIDTGMSRIGYQVSEASADEIAKTAELKNLKIEGVFTHFAKQMKQIRPMYMVRSLLIRKCLQC